MDTTSTSNPPPYKSISLIKTLLIGTALILLIVSGYLYFTTAGRLDLEIFGEGTTFAAEVAALPEEAREVLETERNRELLRRQTAFGAFAASGLVMILLAIALKRRAFGVAVTAFLVHSVASGLYLILAKTPATEDAMKAFGGPEMTPEKQAIWAMIIIGALGTITALIVAGRHTSTMAARPPVPAP